MPFHPGETTDTAAAPPGSVRGQDKINVRLGLNRSPKSADFGATDNVLTCVTTRRRATRGGRKLTRIETHPAHPAAPPGTAGVYFFSAETSKLSRFHVD